VTQTLTRTGIVAPSADNTDPFDPVTYIRNVGTALEAKGVLYSQGLLAARPAAGTAGRWYKPTDTGSESLIYWDDGTAWQAIGTGAPTDGSAATPSLRTLGAGATQAAAGNHTHAASAITGYGGDNYILTLMGAL
jgi:hypothetical protein